MGSITARFGFKFGKKFLVLSSLYFNSVIYSSLSLPMIAEDRNGNNIQTGEMKPNLIHLVKREIEKFPITSISNPLLLKAEEPPKGVEWDRGGSTLTPLKKHHDGEFDKPKDFGGEDHHQKKETEVDSSTYRGTPSGDKDGQQQMYNHQQNKVYSVDEIDKMNDEFNPPSLNDEEKQQFKKWLKTQKTGSKFKKKVWRPTGSRGTKHVELELYMTSKDRIWFYKGPEYYLLKWNSMKSERQEASRHWWAMGKYWLKESWKEAVRRITWFFRRIAWEFRNRTKSIEKV